MTTSRTGIIVPLSSLPVLTPFSHNRRRGCWTGISHLWKQDIIHPLMVAAMPLDVVTLIAFFRHERPREPVALMAQDQRMGLGLEFLHLVIVRSLISKSCPVHSKVKKDTSWRDVWGQTYWIIVCGPWLREWQSILSSQIVGFHFNFIFIHSVLPEETMQLFISRLQPIS